MHAIAWFSAESVRLSATGNSTELGGVVRESFVRSAWFPVAVNRITEWTSLHGSQLSQSDSVELVLPETRLNEQTNKKGEIYCTCATRCKISSVALIFGRKMQPFGRSLEPCIYINIKKTNLFSRHASMFPQRKLPSRRKHRNTDTCEGSQGSRAATLSNTEEPRHQPGR